MHGAFHACFSLIDSVESNRALIAVNSGWQARTCAERGVATFSLERVVVLIGYVQILTRARAWLFGEAFSVFLPSFSCLLLVTLHSIGAELQLNFSFDLEASFSVQGDRLDLFITLVAKASHSFKMLGDTLLAELALSRSLPVCVPSQRTLQF